MANVRHLVAQVEGAGTLWAAGRIQVNGTTATMTQISSPQFNTSDITLIRVAAGLYQVTLKNFKGPIGFVVPVVSAGSTSFGATGVTTPIPLSAAVGFNSYTTGTDTYSFTVGVSSGNTYTEAEVYWQAVAF